MQFGLLSLLLSFIVFCSAIAAFDVYGFLVAPILLGIAACIRTAPSMWKAAVRVMWCICLLLFLLFLLLPFVHVPREAARRGTCANNLKQLGIALYNYHEAHGSFPPAYISDANGKPMHSWRTLLLPFMDHQDIYDKYNFKEPWNSVNNSKLAVPLPEFICPTSLKEPAFTSYVAVVAPNTAWPGEKATRVRDFPVGWTRQTVMLVEVANSNIPWMEPRDVTVDEAIRAIRSGLHPKRNDYFHYDQTGVNVAFADGGAHFLPADTPTKTLEALLTINDGKTLPDIELLCNFPEPQRHWRHTIALPILVSSYALLLFRPRRRNVVDAQGAQA